MHERRKMSQRDWPYNLWDDIVTERKEKEEYFKKHENTMPYLDDQNSGELYISNLDTVLSDALTEAQERIIRLRYERKMSYKEIAEALGISQSRPQGATREALLRLIESKNYFRLKALPVTEILKQAEKYNALNEKNEKLKQNYEELEQRNIELKKQLSEEIENRKNAEEAVDGLTKKTPIDEIGLNVRAYNALNRAGIGTVGELIAHTEKELLLLPHMGKGTLANIVETLHSYDYDLKK